jgi:hypothetical protein
MNPSMVLTLAAGLLLLLTGITTGSNGTDDTPRADETDRPSPRDA